MVCNFSKDSDYHSQINNKIVPLSSCNTTSMIMALKQAKVQLPDYTGQPEDTLSAFLQTKEAYRMQKILAPWSYLNYPPQEVHVCLEWGTNTWIGQEVDHFTTETKLEDIAPTLKKGKGIIISGIFRVGDYNFNHIVSIAGFVKEESITHYIIDDPYGDWTKQYKDHHGNNVVLTVEQFKSIFDKQGKYWTHIVSA